MGLGSALLIIAGVTLAASAFRFVFPPTRPSSYIPRGFGDRPVTATAGFSRIRNGR